MDLPTENGDVPYSYVSVPEGNFEVSPILRPTNLILEESRHGSDLADAWAGECWICLEAANPMDTASRDKVIIHGICDLMHVN